MRHVLLIGLVAGLLAVLPIGAAAAQDDSQPQVILAPPEYDLERIEIPEAGLAMLLPVDWDVDTSVEESEFQLPPEYVDSAAVESRQVVYAENGLGDWCSLTTFSDIPLSPEEHAQWDADRIEAGSGGGLAASGSLWVVGDEIGHEFELVRTSGFGAAQEFVWDLAGTRYALMCASSAATNRSWSKIADSVEPLDEVTPAETTGADSEAQTPVETPSIEQIGDLQRVSVSEAGVTVSFPADWNVEIEMAEKEVAPTDPDQSPISYLNVVFAERVDGTWCQLQRYDMVVDDLSAFGDTVARTYLADASDDATADVSSTELAIGEAARIELFDPAVGRATLYYTFASETALFELSCMGARTDKPVMDEIAQTLAWPASTDQHEPDSALTVESADAVSNFGSVVQVADGMLMSADCQLAVWVAFSDGSFREDIDCTLSDAPVAQQELQGVRPDELLTVSGGECEWTSDYWAMTDGSDVWASSYELTITPDGHVFGSSTYAPEMLECAD